MGLSRVRKASWRSDFNRCLERCVEISKIKGIESRSIGEKSLANTVDLPTFLLEVQAGYLQESGSK